MVQKRSHHKKVGAPLLKDLLKIGAVLLNAAKPLVHNLRVGMDQELDHYVKLLEKRLAVLAIWIFVTFLSVLALGLGFLFILVDSGGIPRGVACLLGALLGLVVLALGAYFTKESEKAS